MAVYYTEYIAYQIYSNNNNVVLSRPKSSTSIILGRIYIKRLHLYHLKLHIIHHTVKHVQVANILSKLQNETEPRLINYTIKRELEISKSKLTILTNTRIVHFKSSCVSVFACVWVSDCFGVLAPFFLSF
jgi:hypothetical protein